MNKEISNDNPDHEDAASIREYSPAQELINNIPYLAMTMLGTVIFLATLGSSAWGLMAAAAYLAYGLMGAVWIMIFVCPYSLLRVLEHKVLSLWIWPYSCKVS